MNIAYVILPLVLAMLFYFAKVDRRRYEAFKQLTDTKDRQRTLSRWLIESFLLYGCLAVLILAVLGRLDTITQFPDEFKDVLSEQFLAFGSSEGDTAELSGDLEVANADTEPKSIFESLPVLLSIGIGLGLLIRIFTAKKGNNAKPAGDVEAMLPRNGTERFWAALLSLNAGLSEELFFRLMMPLLLYMVLGNALAAFAIAAVMFGFIHWYQGPAGVIATMFLGFVITVFYLVAESIWVPVAFHAVIDLVNLVLVPWLAQPKDPVAE